MSALGQLCLPQQVVVKSGWQKKASANSAGWKISIAWEAPRFLQSKFILGWGSLSTWGEKHDQEERIRENKRRGLQNIWTRLARRQCLPVCVPRSLSHVHEPCVASIPKNSAIPDIIPGT